MKRIAVVDNEKLKDMDEKLRIQSLCPVNRSGTECIKIEGKKLLIDEDTCIGCGICVKPSHGAIKIINLPTSAEGTPIHRYGENSFALYSLPAPSFGKVVGILGVNGIGKSTAMQIIAGTLKPNFGEETPADDSYDRLIDFFRGTEAQTFFEKIRAGRISIAYKPQQVDMIPKQAKGTVRELLQRVDERGRMEEISDTLELEKILDHDISKIAGGELQRVAIAATVLKKANLYMFDEPTSYLDINQRIKVSRFIRDLADEDTAVLVIEHDLIILDYMTDLIHIMYGKEGAFGVVSQVKSTKAGINTYLSGYLKEENVRFRDHSIRFLEKPPTDTRKEEKLIGWQDIRKKLGSFSLSSGKGEIAKNHVVGVLGPNGIGKTSFVKILAGVLEADFGNLDRKVTVSYKPQYLEPVDQPVALFLKDAIQKYDVGLIRPLQIKPLLDKTLSQLSGGELQRVAIASALAKDAEMYLLDEPSAYLDVEQRLTVSKVIRDMMETRSASCMVVDHDILFLDYLSEGLAVFSGEPAISGNVDGPFSMEEGMNRFLGDLQISMRRDQESRRPRVNKPKSQMDRKQRSENKLYYG